MTEHIDNILIRQKDILYALINENQLDLASNFLDYIKELWDELNYGYKWKEVKERLLFERKKLEIESEEWYNDFRKKCESQ